MKMRGKENTKNGKEEQEKSHAAHEHGAKTLGSRRTFELRNVYRLSHLMLRILDDRQRVIKLLVDAHEQGATTSKRAGGQIRWNPARLKQIANLPAFSRAVENA